MYVISQHPTSEQMQTKAQSCAMRASISMMKPKQRVKEQKLGKCVCVSVCVGGCVGVCVYSCELHSFMHTNIPAGMQLTTRQISPPKCQANKYSMKESP